MQTSKNVCLARDLAWPCKRACTHKKHNNNNNKETKQNKKTALFEWVTYRVAIVKREPCKTHLGHSGHVHTNTDIFETTQFFIRIRVYGILNHSGERFQSNAVSVRGFTGFVWTEGRFVWKSMRFQKYEPFSHPKNLRFWLAKLLRGPARGVATFKTYVSGKLPTYPSLSHHFALSEKYALMLAWGGLGGQFPRNV